MVRWPPARARLLRSLGALACLGALAPCCTDGGDAGGGARDALAMPADASSDGHAPAPAPLPPVDGGELACAPDAGSLSCDTYCCVFASACGHLAGAYASTADCVQRCAAAGWPEGTPGQASGDTLWCRVVSAARRDCRSAGADGGTACR